MKRSICLVLVPLCLSCASKPNNEAHLSPQRQKAHEEWARREKLSLTEIEKEYASKKREVFYSAEEVIEHAIREKTWDKAQMYAEEFLDQAANEKKNWNYGNAIFYANMALSRVAFEKHQMKEARKYLLAASQTPGSPQLDSFGPFNSAWVRDLLKDFIKAKENKTVIEFANNCRKFVSKKPEKPIPESEIVERQNIAEIDHFLDQAQKGEEPDFKTPESQPSSRN